LFHDLLCCADALIADVNTWPEEHEAGTCDQFVDRGFAATAERTSHTALPYHRCTLHCAYEPLMRRRELGDKATQLRFCRSSRHRRLGAPL